MRRKSNATKENKELKIKINALEKQIDRTYDKFQNEVLVNRNLSSELGKKILENQSLIQKIENLERLQEKTERVIEGAVRFKVVENLIQPLEQRIAALEAKQ